MCLIVLVSLTACLSFTKHETVINRVDRMRRPSTCRDRPTDRPTNETFLARFNCFCLSCATSRINNLNCCNRHSALLCALLSEWSYSTLHRLMGSIDHQRACINQCDSAVHCGQHRVCARWPPVSVGLLCRWHCTMCPFVARLLTQRNQSDARPPRAFQLSSLICLTCSSVLQLRLVTTNYLASGLMLANL